MNAYLRVCEIFQEGPLAKHPVWSVKEKRDLAATAHGGHCICGSTGAQGSAGESGRDSGAPGTAGPGGTAYRQSTGSQSLVCIRITWGLIRTYTPGCPSQSFWFSQSLVRSKNLHFLTSSQVILCWWSGIRLWNTVEHWPLFAASPFQGCVQAPPPPSLLDPVLALLRIQGSCLWLSKAATRSNGQEKAQVSLFPDCALLLQLWGLTSSVPYKWWWLHRHICIKEMS